MAKEWFRNSEWSDEIEASFRTRLNRSRTDYNRAQYLRIQGGYLIGTPHNQKGLELLREVLRRFPHEESEIAICWVQIAEGCKHLGDIAASRDALRQAVAQENRTPNSLTDAALTLAYELAVSGPPWDVVEIQQMLRHMEFHKLSSESMFPVSSFRVNVVRAALSFALGDKPIAFDHAKKALAAANQKQSSLVYHRNLGVMNEIPEPANRLIQLVLTS